MISPIAKTKAKVCEKFTVLPYSNNALVTNLPKIKWKIRQIIKKSSIKCKQFFFKMTTIVGKVHYFMWPQLGKKLPSKHQTSDS